jgi:putative acetyltransferase
MKYNDHIIITNYTVDNLHDVISIFQQSVRKVAVRDYNEEQIASWSAVDPQRWAVRRSSRPTWIAWIDGRPAGFTDLEPDGHLDMLFVHPEFQNIGVASVLLKTVEKHAHELRLNRIFTEASITARPFFERRGFKIITEQFVDIRGATLKNYRMEKHLPR